MYLIQRQRVLAHKLENLYQSWDADPTAGSKTRDGRASPTVLVHITLPETQKSGEVFVPEELQSNSLSGVRLTGAGPQRNIMQPRAFESVFKSLEAKEQKVASDKAKAAEQEPEDGDLDDNEEDLVRWRVVIGKRWVHC